MKRWAAYCKENDFAMLGSMIVLALALSLLVGCAGGESQPVVTDDDLTSNSVVQAVLNLDVGNGKTYAYVWADSDPEELAGVIIEANHLEARIRAWQADLERAIGQGDEEYLRQISDLSIDEARLEYEKCKSGELLKEQVQEIVGLVQAQLALDPVVSPQEAANRAGVLIEETYGISLSDQKLILNCSQTDPTAAVMYHYNGRMVWTATLMQPDGSGSLLERFSGVIDATTGEWIRAEYTLSEDEMTMLETNSIASFVIASESRFDTENPAYFETVEAEKPKVMEAFAKSSLAEGAAVTGVRMEEDFARMVFCFTCDNGKTYRLLRTSNYFEYDFGGYPLRAYTIWNTEFLHDIPADGTM
ncbi:MAG: hypothetical protein NC311_19370 [Muribaculaceae bacterium]|nr:hypothetical protein [Muribaculaceae bacterium]